MHIVPIQRHNDLVRTAYRRKVALGLARPPGGGSSSENSNWWLDTGEAYKLRASATETARADNQSLAQAAHQIVQALQHMKQEGWIDDETAARLAFKFAGEPISDHHLAKILHRPGPPDLPEPTP